MFNKFNSKVISTALLLVSQVPAAYATHQGGLEHVGTTTAVNIPLIVENVMNFGVALLIAIAALFILWAAYMYLTAGAIEGNMDKAKHYILYAVVAIFIALIAKALPLLVKSFFPG